MPWGTPDLNGDGDGLETSIMTHLGSGRRDIFYPADYVSAYIVWNSL